MARVAIVGTGLIGRARSITFARAGHDVVLIDSNSEAPAAAISYIDTILGDLAHNDLLNGTSPKTSFPASRRTKTW